MIRLPKIPSSEITSEATYLNRRKLLQGAGFLAATAAVAACAPSAPTLPPAAPAESAAGASSNGASNGAAAPVAPTASTDVDELGDALNSYTEITNYNNYYEFTTDKVGVARLSKDFTTSPWQVEVSGMVRNPKVYDMDDLRRFEQEERIYRLRCVEAWSMVIPWIGFPLAKLLAEVEPTADAKYVRFTTVERPEQMPGQRNRSYSWPYVEGLRVDEAMNELAILATGLYGVPLLPQSGAPIRLVVPWKYGFKSIKSIVKIELVSTTPISLWMDAAPREYGFYANVNPDVNHPRWSQASERRIGELSRRATLPFNGYGEQVASLYAGMDLQTYF